MIKSLDYLERLVRLYDEDELLDILESIGYILTDNGETKARYLLMDLEEIVEKANS